MVIHPVSIYIDHGDPSFATCSFLTGIASDRENVCSRWQGNPDMHHWLVTSEYDIYMLKLVVSYPISLLLFYNADDALWFLGNTMLIQRLGKDNHLVQFPCVSALSH